MWTSFILKYAVMSYYEMWKANLQPCVADVHEGATPSLVIIRIAGKAQVWVGVFLAVRRFRKMEKLLA